MNRNGQDKWTSIGFAGGIAGVAMFLISTIAGYIQINSEASGTFFPPSFGGTILTCLVGAFTGMLAIWHYTTHIESSLTLGRGALIGVLSGVTVVILNTLLSKLWGVVDADYSRQLMETTIANIENMKIPEDLKQQQIDMVAQQFREMRTIGGFVKQVLFGLPLYLILNAITAMIGVKLFGAKKEEVE